MLNKVKDAILYEDFDSSDEFSNAFIKRYDELIDIKDTFDGFSDYSDDELSNNNLEVKIAEEFEEFSSALKKVIDEVESSKGGVR